MRFKLLTVVLLLSSVIHVHGQGKNALALFKSTTLVADEFYANMDYRSALHFYNKALEKNSNNQEVEMQVAECYLKLNDSKKAELWLADLAKKNQAEAKILLKYAEVLRTNGNLEEAALNYEKVMQIAPSLEVQSKLDFIRNRGYYADPQTYILNNLALNSEQSDFSPQLLAGGILFLSSRQSENFIQYQPSSASNDDEGMLRYYYFTNETVEPYYYGEKLKASFHDGPLAVYQNDGKVAYTRNNLKDGVKARGVSRVNLKIFFAERSNDNTWINQQPFPYNSEDYSCGHPTLNDAGDVMYFSSDMPGGFGGTDLYVSRFVNGSWSEPKNLGSHINTSESELFPNLNKNELYFASAGHGGFGGLDIFKSNLIGESEEWSKPINVGAPINSESDDFAFLLNKDGRGGYFSSNRPGGKGLDDIYSFSVKELLVIGRVVQKQNPEINLSNALVTILDTDKNQIKTLITDSLGVFRTPLPYDQSFLINVSKEEHSSLLNAPFTTTGLNDTLNLSLWRHELFVKGRLFSNETQALLPNVTIQLANIETGITETITTGNDGTYLFALTPNNKYEIKATRDGYLENGYKMNTGNIFKGELLNDILLEEVYVDKLVTYFDFNESILKNSYSSSLKQLLRTLQKFPEAIITVTAHADARGTIDYNKKLSQKRVDAIQSYFIANGITKERIHGTAFGEELLLNQCSDGVDCGEEDHSQNRRAELKVQMNAVH